MALLPDQAATLRRLDTLWQDRRFMLVGATAVGCWMDMRWRATRDVDVCVACAFADFPCGLDRLAGWTRGIHEHQWVSPEGVRVDVLPVGPDLLAAGKILWRNGRVMKLTGFRLALDTVVARQDVAPGLTLHVPPLHVLILLKMASYLDRPLEREHDLSDLAHVLREGIPPQERFTEETLNADVDWEVAGAFLLGSRLRPLVDSHDRGVVDAFLRELMVPGGSSRAFDRMLATMRPRHHEYDEEDAAHLVQLWHAYDRGFAERA